MARTYFGARQRCRDRTEAEIEWFQPLFEFLRFEGERCCKVAPSEIIRRRIDEAAQLFGAVDVDGAKKSLETLLAKSPTIFRHEVDHHLASIARKLGDVVSAIANLGRAAKLQPNDPETWLKLGIVNLESQSFEASADAFKRLVQLVPNSAEPLTFLESAL